MAEPANCLGVASRGKAQLRGTGALALGSEALVFDYWVISRRIAIPRRAIRRVEHVRSHLGKSVGATLIKVSFVNDEHLYDQVAFRVIDVDAWTAALEAVVEENAARVGRPATEASPLAVTVAGRALRMSAWMVPSFPLTLGWVMACGALLPLSPVGTIVGAAGLLTGAVGLFVQWGARKKFARQLVKDGAAYEAGPEGLKLDGELVAPAWTLQSGAVLPTDGGALVVLSRGRLRGDVRLKVASVEEGRALIDALGVGTRDRALTRKIASRIFSPVGYLAAVLPFLGGIPLALLASVLGASVETIPMAFALGLFWMLASFYTVGFVKTRLTIAADGVRIAWLGRERVIALEEIASVEAGRGFLGSRRVTLALRSGERVDITVAMRGSNIFEPFDAETESALIVERLRDALRVREGLEEASLEAWMDNAAGLSAGAWMRDLRLHVRSQMKERGAELLQGLLQMVENANVPAAMRAAAAAARGPRHAEPARARVRAAAEGSAVPKLRVALEAAAEDRDEDLVEAFTELSSEHRAKVRVELDEELLAEAEQEVEAFLHEGRGGYRGRAD